MWDQNFEPGMIQGSSPGPSRRPKCLLNFVVLLILLKVESNAQRPNLNNVGKYKPIHPRNGTFWALLRGQREAVTNSMAPRMLLFDIVSCLIEVTTPVPGAPCQRCLI